MSQDIPTKAGFLSAKPACSVRQLEVPAEAHSSIRHA